MLRVEAGQIIEEPAFYPCWHLSVNDSIGAPLTDLTRLREVVTVGIVLREMLLVVLVATAHEGCIQRLSSGKRSEAIGGRQIFFTQLLDQGDELGVDPLRFSV